MESNTIKKAKPWWVDGPIKKLEITPIEQIVVEEKKDPTNITVVDKIPIDMTCERIPFVEEKSSEWRRAFLKHSVNSCITDCTDFCFMDMDDELLFDYYNNPLFMRTRIAKTKLPKREIPPSISSKCPPHLSNIYTIMDALEMGVQTGKCTFDDMMDSSPVVARLSSVIIEKKIDSDVFRMLKKLLEKKAFVYVTMNNESIKNGEVLENDGHDFMITNIYENVVELIDPYVLTNFNNFKKYFCEPEHVFEGASYISKEMLVNNAKNVTIFHERIEVREKLVEYNGKYKMISFTGEGVFKLSLPIEYIDKTDILIYQFPGNRADSIYNYPAQEPCVLKFDEEHDIRYLRKQRTAIHRFVNDKYFGLLVVRAWMCFYIRVNNDVNPDQPVHVPVRLETFAKKLPSELLAKGVIQQLWDGDIEIKRQQQREYRLFCRERSFPHMKDDEKLIEEQKRTPIRNVEVETSEGWKLLDFY